MHIDNLAKWDKKQNGFYEVWYLKLNLPGPCSLWLRFTSLSLKTGLKNVVEVWGIFTDLRDGKQKKIAIKNSNSPAASTFTADGLIQIEDCIFNENSTKGRVVGRNHDVQWDLKFDPNQKTFFHVPQTLAKLKLSKSTVCKPNVDIYFTGSFTIDGETFECENAPGCQGHIWGKKYAHAWAWAHCNDFVDSTGKKSSAIVEMLTAQVKLGGALVSPKMSAFYFKHGDLEFEFNNLWDCFTIKSDYKTTGWNFSCDRGQYRIVIQLETETKNLVGITYETTDGTFMYCNNTAFAAMQVLVYKDGKLTQTLKSTNSASFETVSGEKSKYVEVIL